MFKRLSSISTNSTQIDLKKSESKVSIFLCLPFAWHQTGNTFTCGSGELKLLFLGGKKAKRKMAKRKWKGKFIVEQRCLWRAQVFFFGIELEIFVSPLS